MIIRRLYSSFTLPPTIRQLLSAPNPPKRKPSIHVNGWIKSVRRQKNVVFAAVTDGSSAQPLQAVFSNVNLAKNLTNGASVRLTGVLVESPGLGQDKELQVDSVEVLGPCDPELYPIQKQSLSVDYLRDNCHLRARTDSIASMLRLRDRTSKALHDYFENQGFTYVHTPILTSSDCEGAGEVFRIAPPPPKLSSSPAQTPAEFFGHPVYLTVSSQLHLESLATALSRVFTLSPCFRAERSQTSRHLAEFWMLEAEWAFTRSVADVCDVVEGSIKNVLQQTASTWGGDDAQRKVLQAAAEDRPWVRMSYRDAVDELARRHSVTGEFHVAPVWGKTLQSEHERWLAETLVRGPVFVTDYPASLKPFYMRANDDGATVGCFDLLVPHVGELAGGSLREERVEMLEDALRRHGLGKEYEWYVDLRKFGGAPHGGFGMGFERLVGWLGGIANVRECVAMPRWAGRMLL